MQESRRCSITQILSCVQAEGAARGRDRSRAGYNAHSPALDREGHREQANYFVLGNTRLALVALINSPLASLHGEIFAVPSVTLADELYIPCTCSSLAGALVSLVARQVLALAAA